MILNESLFESISTIEYRDISDLDHYKKSANDILGGYGDLSDNSILDSNKEIYIDGELKGYIGLSEYEEDGTRLLGIGNFMILERGKGYGTQVINDIVSKYKNEFDLIYCFVDADNTGAISLYKKLGKVYDEDGPNDNGQYYVTFYDNGKYKLEESLDQEKSEIYHRFMVIDDKGQNKGGIFRGLNQLLKDLWDDDSEYYDYINDPLSELERLTPNPENIDDTNTIFAYKESFYNQNEELFEDIEYALSEIGWELVHIELSRPNTIVYEDDTQIAYNKGTSSEDTVSESLTEARKKRKNKKNVSEVKPGDAVFKSVRDMQKWVKARQKGLSPFCSLTLNAGNVEYNTALFNKMMGSIDSSVGTSEGGTSTGVAGDVSVGAVGGDAGGGI